ncbi:hypothetical protein SASPL_104860 [Salvia splendens]|uniref:Uncharacterized protein n=1 Tax=Salvia splendens TaxID=180675 RepID=A0A8X8YMH5_SALSN|nr:hypothetical protein SASPL_104860 [Salvia splendens]
MAERRHGGRRGGGHGGGRGDLPNEEATRQRDLCDIENDDLRQQVRDLQRDIENGDLRQQVRELQRRLARLEKRQGKSNPMRSNEPKRRSMEDPLFSDVFTSSEADEPSKNSNSNIFLMSVYDTPVYDDIFYELPKPLKNSNNNILSMLVYDKPVYDEDMLSMSVYNKPVYDEDIFYELPRLISESPPPSVIFDDAAEDKGVVVDDDEEYDKAERGNHLQGEYRKLCDEYNDFTTCWNVLHHVDEIGNFEICKFLIKTVEVYIDEGDTPLAEAVKGEHIKIAEFLIITGC